VVLWCSLGSPQRSKQLPVGTGFGNYFGDASDVVSTAIDKAGAKVL
jgi:hypothetical protein